MGGESKEFIGLPVRPIQWTKERPYLNGVDNIPDEENAGCLLT